MRAALAVIVISALIYGALALLGFRTAAPTCETAIPSIVPCEAKP